MINKHDMKSLRKEKKIKTVSSMYPVNCCPFCGGKVKSGSWTPGICIECGAEEVGDYFYLEED